MSKPKILLLDIETSPIKSYHYGLFDQNIGIGQIIEDWRLMSYCAKWYDDPDKTDVIYEDCRAKTKEKGWPDDFDLLMSLHKLLDDADFIIAHNGQRFDLPKIMARFLLSNMPPPSPVGVIDTMRMAKSMMKMTSNKLEFLTRELCTDHHKLGHGKYPGFKLWAECLANNDEAWEEMRVYNIEDVLSMEELYKRLIPFSKNTPHLSNWTATETNLACPKCSCAEEGMIQKRGYAMTQGGKYQKYVCLKCRGWSRGKKNLLEHRQNALVNVSR